MSVVCAGQHLPATAACDRLQPNAIVFQGAGVSANPVRWIGTEAGVAPYRNWSRDSGAAAGGAAGGDAWVWLEPVVLRAGARDPQPGGTAPSPATATCCWTSRSRPMAWWMTRGAFARYKEFGDWVRGCSGPGGGGTHALTIAFDLPQTLRTAR